MKNHCQEKLVLQVQTATRAALYPQRAKWAAGRGHFAVTCPPCPPLQAISESPDYQWLGCQKRGAKLALALCVQALSKRHLWSHDGMCCQERGAKLALVLCLLALSVSRTPLVTGCIVTFGYL
jgi:hypothetical protein